MDRNSFSFVVYMIHACADRWKKLPSEVYNSLQESGCIEKFLVPHYDILHTQGTEYVVKNIQEYLDVRGISV